MNEIFWKIVRELLKEKKIAQTTLARSLGIEVRTFQDWVYSKKLPDTVSAKKIADYLGVSLDYLLTGEKGDPAALDSQGAELIDMFYKIKPNHRCFVYSLASKLASTEISCIEPPVNKE